MKQDRRGRGNFKQKCKPLRSQVEGHCANFSPFSRFRNGCHGWSRSWNGKSGRMLTTNKRTKATKIFYQKFLPQKSAFVSENNFKTRKLYVEVRQNVSASSTKELVLHFLLDVCPTVLAKVSFQKSCLATRIQSPGILRYSLLPNSRSTEPSGQSLIISESRVQGAKTSVT